MQPLQGTNKWTTYFRYFLSLPVIWVLGDALMEITTMMFHIGNPMVVLYAIGLVMAV